MVGTRCYIATVASTILSMCAGPVGALRSSALLNHKHLINAHRNAMNCACGISPVFWIFWLVGTCLCVTKETFTVKSMNWVSAFATCLPHHLRLWSPFNPTQQYCSNGFSHRLNHWHLPLRQDRNFDDLLDELQLLNLRALSGPSAPVVAKRLA